MLLVWSTNYIVGKIALRHLDGVTLAGFRFQISAVLLLVIYYARGPRTRVGWKDLWTFGYLGLLGFALNQGCWVIGLSHTTSDHSAIIVATAPILVLVLASALRLERLTPAKAIGMAISFLGVILLETDQGSPTHSPLLVGDVITLCGTLAFSLYAVLSRRVAGAYDTLTMITFNAIAAAVLFSPIAIRQGLRLEWGHVGWVGWAGLFYVAIMSGVVGFLLFYWLVRHMEASRVVVVNYFQPVAVFLLSMPLLGERPTARLLESGALVLLGVYLAERVPV